MKTIFKILVLTSLLGAQNAWATASGDSGTGSAAPSVNQSANTSQSQNNSGQAMSMMTAAMYAAMSAMEASQCSPTNSTACVMSAIHAGMAALSAMQAGEHGNKADMSGITAADTNAIGAKETLGGTGSASVDAQTADMKKLAAGINGVKADFKTGTVSVNGKNYPASSFSSPAAMAAAGFGADQIASALSVVDKVNKKVEAKYGSMTGTNGFEDGSGGGGMAASSSGDTAATGPATGPGLGAADRNPAQIAGMQKDFNGEPVGVAGDNIFEMMNRRYKYKDRQNAFIDENDLLMQK